MKKQLLLAVVVMGLLTGCHSTSMLTFDVWRPAKITVPTDITRVTVVNNSIDPDEREGNIYTDWNNKQYALVIGHDSTSYRLAEHIAVALSETEYFPEITIFYDDSIALPKASYPPLTVGQLNTIRAGGENVAVIALDKTDMKVAMTDRVVYGELGETLFSTELAVATTADMSIYWHNRATPTVEQVTDTLYWQALGYTPEESHERLPLPEEFLQASMQFVSEKVCRLFIPHLDHVNRYLYVSTLPALSDAYDYWKNEKYTEASYLWEYVYEEDKKGYHRAMAAANLALYNELNDSYEAAIEWVDKSLALLGEKPGRYSDDIAHLQNYRRQLVERRDDNSILQQQM